MMKYQIKIGDPKKISSDCLVVGVYQGKKMAPAAAALDRTTRGQIELALQQNDIDGEAGSTLLLTSPGRSMAKRILLVGLNKAEKTDREAYRKAMKSAASRLKKMPIRNATLFLLEAPVEDADSAWKTEVAVQAIEQSCYVFDDLKSKKPPKITLNKVLLASSDKTEKDSLASGLKRGQAVASGVAYTKWLSDLPGNICTPSYLADRARELGKSHNLKITVLEEARMKKLGMGALLSVSRGSREPAKLIVMEYKGGDKDAAPVVLVGKGLTFDSGGISIKPSAKMDEMKYDMCGGASVFGVMIAAAKLALPINLVGIVPSSENMPDGAANKPGDIVTSMSGQTIEVLNTDAEGRLILCDALTYAERYKPDVVIDIATLTGACVVALGDVATGLFSNRQALAEEIYDAGEQSADRAWQLPLWKEYDKKIDSPFADINNTGGRDAGAITAAAFLARFTKNMTWAHLDIAGTAWSSGSNKGATGRPVPLLMQFLQNRCQ